MLLADAAVKGHGTPRARLHEGVSFSVVKMPDGHARVTFKSGDIPSSTSRAQAASTQASVAPVVLLFSDAHAWQRSGPWPRGGQRARRCSGEDMLKGPKVREHESRLLATQRLPVSPRAARRARTVRVWYSV